jgi:hypothetical protein
MGTDSVSWIVLPQTISKYCLLAFCFALFLANIQLLEILFFLLFSLVSIGANSMEWIAWPQIILLILLF